MSPIKPPHDPAYPPGFYVIDGVMHIDVPEVLAACGIPDTPEEREKAAAILAEEARGRGVPDVEVV